MTDKPVEKGGHFWWSETGCSDGTPYPAEWLPRLLELLHELEAIRAECCQEAGIDVPLSVSIYRSPARQQALINADRARIAAGLEPIYKAARRSQHVEGRAADITAPRELTWEQFETCVERAAARQGSKIRYIEYRPRRYIHVDTRPTQRLVQETVN